MSLKLFDTHTHYDDRAYDGDRHELIAEMLADSERGVAGFMAMGCSLGRSRRAAELAGRYETVYAAVGIHPGDVDGLPGDYLAQLEALCLGGEKIKAIGEIGLDYHYEGHDRELQMRVFEEQLLLAEKLRKPVVIHSREATADTLDMLKKHKKEHTKMVMHCFSGSAETARILVGMGVMVSFTGVLTFKNARKAVEACKAVPLEMLMLETDCPYMAPQPFRGARCDSRMAWFTAQKIAQIKGKTTDEIVEICNENARRFFDISF